MQGFLSTETIRALDFFEQATDCFRRALDEVCHFETFVTFFMLHLHDNYHPSSRMQVSIWCAHCPP